MRKIIACIIVGTLLFPIFSTDYTEVIKVLKNSVSNEVKENTWSLKPILDEFIDFTEKNEIINNDRSLGCSYNLAKEYWVYTHPIIHITDKNIYISLEYDNANLNFIEKLDPLDDITIKFRLYSNRAITKEEIEQYKGNFKHIKNTLILETSESFCCTKSGGNIILSNEASLFFAKSLANKDCWMKILITSGQSKFIIYNIYFDNIHKLINKLGPIPENERDFKMLRRFE